MSYRVSSANYNVQNCIVSSDWFLSFSYNFEILLPFYGAAVAEILVLELLKYQLWSHVATCAQKSNPPWWVQEKSDLHEFLCLRCERCSCQTFTFYCLVSVDSRGKKIRAGGKVGQGPDAFWFHVCWPRNVRITGANNAPTTQQQLRLSVKPT